MNRTSQFWLRKLHSLTGGTLLALFLMVHIFSPGANPFDRGFLFKLLLFSLPLVFHVVYGAVVICETDWPRYPFVNNWRYVLQRGSALVIAVFLLVHVYVMSVRPAWIHSPAHICIWVVGTLVTLYHLLNGCAGLLIHWGITIGSKSQKAVLVVFLLVCLVAMVRALAGIAELTGQLPLIQPLNRLLF